MAIQRENTNLILDFQAPNRAVVAHAKQNDKLSRYLTCQMVDGGIPWVAPGNIASAIRFKKPDGHGGFYDVDEKGNSAVIWSGSNVTLYLAEQVLTVPGDVYMELNVYTAQSEKLTSFSWILNVEKSVLSDAEIQSTDYYNILTQQIADILGRVQSIAGMLATAEGVGWGTGTSVTVTGGTGSQDPYVLHFLIEQAKALVTKVGHIVTIATGDATGESDVSFVEPQAKVTKVDDVLTVSLTDVDGTTEETLLAAAIRLATFHIDLTTGQLIEEMPSDYTEMTWLINSDGELVANY